MALGLTFSPVTADVAPTAARPSFWTRLLRATMAARRREAALIVRRDAPLFAAHR